MNCRRCGRICLSAVFMLLLVMGSGSTLSQGKNAHAVPKKQAARAKSKIPDAGKPTPVQPIDTTRKALPPVSSDTTAQPTKPPPFEYRTIENRAFAVGERLTFDVSYGFITAGEAVMAIPAIDELMKRRCYRIEFTVNSLASFSWIFKVEDHYLTFVDVQSIAPLRFEQHVREGSYSRDFTADFDQINHIAKTSEGEHPIPPYVHDIMSAFYYFRAIDVSAMKTGDMVTLHNFYKDTTYELGVKILGRQELEVTAGTFKTIIVEPLVKEGGLFKSEGRIVIWLTDDELKIPVRVNTKVVIGSIDTELRSYEGLRIPIPARIK